MIPSQSQRISTVRVWLICARISIIVGKKQYILEVGDKVVDIFGNVVTIKEILHHENTMTTNYLIEENGNCYQPHEFCGLYIKHLTLDEVKDIVGEIDDSNDE